MPNDHWEEASASSQTKTMFWLGFTVYQSYPPIVAKDQHLPAQHDVPIRTSHCLACYSKVCSWLPHLTRKQGSRSRRELWCTGIDATATAVHNNLSLC
eukprot:scaffold45025_cov74-Cyclotella_meneghiniana.AAC.5